MNGIKLIYKLCKFCNFVRAIKHNAKIVKMNGIKLIYKLCKFCNFVNNKDEKDILFI